MKYKVLIKRCEDPERAARIGEQVAKWSGSSAAVVSATLISKTICVKREAEEEEALRLKKQFEAAGAEVELEQLASPPPPPLSPSVPKAAAAPAVARTAPPRADDDDDEEEGPPGRVLTQEEFVSALNQRRDIFFIEKDRRLRNIEIIAMVLGIGFSIWLSSVEITNVSTDFIEKMPEERMAKLVKDLPETLAKEEAKKAAEKKAEELKTDKKSLTKNKKAGAGGQTGGGGDPRARVTRKGVLGIISGQIKGKTVASADVFGKGGFASGIDAILSGVGGLSSGGGGGVGRMGVAGIGYGAGYGSGFGGGGGVDDLLGSLMGNEGSLDLSAPALKKRGSLEISAPKFVKGGAVTGGRSMAEIRRVVMQNLAALRYAYNKRLRDKPNLKGRIEVKFAIDEFGAVIFCQVKSTTMNDPELEGEVVDKIKRWAFGKIDKPGDVTEVLYPFVFSE